MPSRKLKFISAKVLLALVILTAIARTPLRAAAEEEAKPAAGTASESENKEQKEFSEKSARLNSLAAKIEEANKHFEELVKQKNEAKDQPEKQRLIKELTETDNERTKATNDFNKLKSELTLRFPNHGIASKRNYQLEGAKPQKDDKGAASLDELLTRTKKIIDKKFAAFTTDPTNSTNITTTTNSDTNTTKTANTNEKKRTLNKNKENEESEKHLRLEK